jgi:hypothetical protein
VSSLLIYVGVLTPVEVTLPSLLDEDEDADEDEDEEPLRNERTLTMPSLEGPSNINRMKRKMFE